MCFLQVLVQDLQKLKKVKFRSNWSSSLPWQHSSWDISSPNTDSLTCLTFAEHLEREKWFSAADLFLLAGIGSGMCELTNKTQLGIQEGGLE